MPEPTQIEEIRKVETAESLAGAAGTAVAEIEDSSRRLVKHANRIPSDTMPKGEKARRAVRKEAGEELEKARAAKNKVAGAAAAAKRFGDARKPIEDAEKSFDEAEDLLDEFDATTTAGSNWQQQNRRLRDAAKKIQDDIGHLKDALVAISEIKEE